MGSAVGRDAFDERGTAALELAIVLPILMMLLLGTVTTGLAFFNHISLNGASREASRFGATYPEEDAASPDAWFFDVATVAEVAAAGALGDGIAGRRICVALGTEGGSARHYLVGPGDPINGGTYADAWCPAGAPSLPAASGHEVVQIVVEREALIQALFFSTTVHLDADATTRFER